MKEIYEWMKIMIKLCPKCKYTLHWNDIHGAYVCDCCEWIGLDPPSATSTRITKDDKFILMQALIIYGKHLTEIHDGRNIDCSKETEKVWNLYKKIRNGN